MQSYFCYGLESVHEAMNKSFINKNHLLCGWIAKVIQKPRFIIEFECYSKTINKNEVIINGK